MNDFAQQVTEWQTFYATIMTCSATLLGLLFISVSLNRGVINRKENPHFQSLSRQTFGFFVYVIGISFTFLVPRQTPLGLGIPITVITIFSFVKVLHAMVTVIKSRRTEGLMRHYALPCLAHCAVLAAAAHILVSCDASSLSSMIFGMTVLLITAVRGSWFLLVEIEQG